MWYARSICVYTRRQPLYSDSWSCTIIKSVLTSFRSIHTHCFLHKYIVWYGNFFYMQSSMVSFTLLIACTTSDVAVWRLSSSITWPISPNIEYEIGMWHLWNVHVTLVKLEVWLLSSVSNQASIWILVTWFGQAVMSILILHKYCILCIINMIIWCYPRSERMKYRDKSLQL